MKVQNILLLIVLIFSLSCNKDDAPSIEEENTFSCKINGELFIPKDYGGFHRFDGILNFISDDSDWTFILSNGKKTVYIYLHKVLDTGEYVLAESDGNGDFFGKESNLMEVDIMRSYPPSHKSIISSGKINVKNLELDTKIVFEFDEIILVGTNDPNNVITLTEGKLNINREALNHN